MSGSGANPNLNPAIDPETGRVYNPLINKVNERKVHRAGLTHLPSPRWHGIVIFVLAAVSLAWIFSYALLDWGWQQERGGWNYTIAGAVAFVYALTLRAWRNDPRRAFAGDDQATRPSR